MYAAMNEHRILRGHTKGVPLSFVDTATDCTRPTTYKTWKDENMVKAMEEVAKCKMSIREAATRYNIPKSTLGDRITGRVQHGALSGPKSYLSSQEESELATFLTRCAAIGYPKTRHEVISLVQEIVDSKGIDSTVSSGWWQAFCKRNPNITLRAPAPLSRGRAYASDPELISRYFDLLEETLDQYDLKEKPCQIFNMDETGLCLDPKSMKCVYTKGERNPVALSSGDKSQITVVACVSAGGYSMPPLVILNRKSLPSYFSVGEVPGTKYGLSTKGWIDRGLFHDWFLLHFLRYAPSERPLLLLLDGHSSHYCPSTIHLAAEQGVVVFVLPPNTTHLLQPLDKGTFGPLKSYWRQECHRFTSNNHGQVVSRYVFSQILSRAWEKCMTLSNVRAGFKVTGVYPLNRNAALKHFGSACKTAANTPLEYLPVLGPVPRKKDSARVHINDQATRRPRSVHTDSDNDDQPQIRPRSGNVQPPRESGSGDGQLVDTSKDGNDLPPTCSAGHMSVDYWASWAPEGSRPEDDHSLRRHWSVDTDSDSVDLLRNGPRSEDGWPQREPRFDGGPSREPMSVDDWPPRVHRYRDDQPLRGLMSENDWPLRGPRSGDDWLPRGLMSENGWPLRERRSGDVWLPRGPMSENDWPLRGHRSENGLPLQVWGDWLPRGPRFEEYQPLRGLRYGHDWPPRYGNDCNPRRPRSVNDQPSIGPRSASNQPSKEPTSANDHPSKGPRSANDQPSRGPCNAGGAEDKHTPSHSVHSLIYCSQAKQFLKTPVPPSKPNPDKTKSCGRVLTSLENIRKMEAAELEKKEKDRLKEERKAKRALKKKSKHQVKKDKEGVSKAVETEFTAEELKLFERRFENGYDLTTDKRYNLWLKNNHPEEGQSICGQGRQVCVHAFVTCRFIND